MKINKKNLSLGEKKLKSSLADNQLQSSYVDDDATVINDRLRFERLRSNQVAENQKACASNVNLREEKQYLRNKQHCSKRLSRSYDNIYFDYSKTSKFTTNFIH